jgi:dTDP-4-amino-4,6-dideoxygalactose transaminase
MEVFGSLENSEVASKNVLSLPIEPLFDEMIVKEIIEKIFKLS